MMIFKIFGQVGLLVYMAQFDKNKIQKTILYYTILYTYTIVKN